MQRQQTVASDRYLLCGVLHGQLQEKLRRLAGENNDQNDRAEERLSVQVPLAHQYLHCDVSAKFARRITYPS